MLITIIINCIIIITIIIIVTTVYISVNIIIVIIIIIIIISIIINISNGNRTEWSPIRSVIITSEKQIWMSAECEFNLFSQVMITHRIGQHKVLLQIYYKNYSFQKLSKAVISRLKNCCC